MNINNLSIVVPAYNEERTILMVLERLLSIQLINAITKEIIVVNDASTDGTSKLVKQCVERNSSCHWRLYYYSRRRFRI